LCSLILGQKSLSLAATARREKKILFSTFIVLLVAYLPSFKRCYFHQIGVAFSKHFWQWHFQMSFGFSFEPFLLKKRKAFS
jgi:hypothetical protein